MDSERHRLLSYDAVANMCGKGRSHILIGNGFSIACDPVFSYPSLYDAAVDAGLSPHAQAVFKELGTNNFEGVMRLLDQAHTVAEIYGLITGNTSRMLDDVQIVKEALITALARSHLNHTGEVADDKKDAALAFLSIYHNVFTTNYDLLLYWVVMHKKEGPLHQDGFRADEDDKDAPYLVFSERLGASKGLFYLHGALHFFLVDGELRKHSWRRSGEPLINLIREGLSRREYPLFVAEGASDRKLTQIQSHGYLWYCLDKFSRIETNLVVFGHSFGDTDEHITDAIARNPKLKRLFVGVYGDPASSANQRVYQAVSRIRAKQEEMGSPRREPLDVCYFDSESASVWGNRETTQ
jgi:hypothetical protein